MSIIGILVEAFLNAFGKALADMFKTWETSREAEAAGKAKSEAEQAREGTRVEAEIADEAGKHTSPDDALKQLEEGTA